MEEFDRDQVALEIRAHLTRQLVYGILWWLASAIAMYFALQSTRSTIYWYGGAIGSLFHWYRAFKLYSLSKQQDFHILGSNQILLIVFAALLIVTSVKIEVPEYFRIQTPDIGTCWANGQNAMFAPVACWSGSARLQTTSYAETLEGCDSNATSYFEPSDSESRFTCLKDV